MEPTHVAERFSLLAGALYGLVGMASVGQQLGPQYDDVQSVLLGALLAAEAVALNEGADEPWLWLEQQVERASKEHGSLYYKLRGKIASSWAVASTILVLSPESRVEDIWRCYCQRYPVAGEAAALRCLLHRMIRDYGGGLFAPGGWPVSSSTLEQYTAPDSCAIAKIRLALKSLCASGTPEQRSYCPDWRSHLTAIRLQESLPKRYTRGLAPQWPLLEEMLLAVLQVAEWLEGADLNRISTSLAQQLRDPAEALSAEQLAFSGLLLGMQRGYNHVSAWVVDQAPRRAISELSMALAVQSAPPTIIPPGLDAVVFYATPAGSRYQLLQPYVRLREWHFEETREFEDNGMQRQTRRLAQARLDVADGSFRFDLQV